VQENLTSQVAALQTSHDRWGEGGGALAAAGSRSRSLTPAATRSCVSAAPACCPLSPHRMPCQLCRAMQAQQAAQLQTLQPRSQPTAPHHNTTQRHSSTQNNTPQHTTQVQGAVGA
jgi:hypothetical protein